MNSNQKIEQLERENRELRDRCAALEAQCGLAVYPDRAVAFRVDAAGIGDGWLCELAADALREYFAADPRGAQQSFRASNGVRIAITPMTDYGP